jgi:hypothetical protein
LFFVEFFVCWIHIIFFKLYLRLILDIKFHLNLHFTYFVFLSWFSCFMLKLNLLLSSFMLVIWKSMYLYSSCLVIIVTKQFNFHGIELSYTIASRCISTTRNKLVGMWKFTNRNFLQIVMHIGTNVYARTFTWTNCQGTQEGTSFQASANW